MAELESAKFPTLEVRDLNVWYGNNHVIKDTSLDVFNNAITAIIGPSGCGKTTFLKALNRLLDLVKSARVTGDVFLEGENIYNSDADPVEIRKRIGLVFQYPNPLPKTIWENIAYGLRIHGISDKEKLNKTVEGSLKEANLWSEVKDRLHSHAFTLSGGQQQRLCVARALAVEPDVIMLDEPASYLDPNATKKLEDLLLKLKEEYTILIVTHNMQQASRISDYTAFIWLGGIIEYGETSKIFTNPSNDLTKKYISGEVG